ncbi:MAG: 16S rRNA (guanine(966)-N(2))-methyltransferase RsmD [Lachnospiraceae bacterium]|nr:16S rRNA (guanine(966)-N(2))-methyltransferase RsmD [Lachnospiraceae bacterium]
MRVIAGTCRSLRLKTPPGEDVRPTTDRIKETLFNIISARIPGADFLDLFCGCGGIGIEALSRGAASSVFVDSSDVSLRYTRDNLEFTKLKDRAEVIRADAAGAISRLFTEGRRFDIIFMDPPYSKGLEKSVLQEIANYNLLKEDGIIIVEAKSDTDFSYVDGLGLEITREKLYGSNKHMFITIGEEGKNGF